MKHYVMYEKEWKDGTTSGGVMKSFEDANDAYDYLDKCIENDKSTKYSLRRIG